MIDSFAEFRDAIRATGLEPPPVLAPGKLYRFPGIDKRRSNRAGWCKLFEDGLGGCFGDWSSGLSETWRADRATPFTLSERAAFMRRVAAERSKAEAERNALQAKAAQRASDIWNSASAAPSDHPYLIRKGIEVHGARLHKGSLMLPYTLWDAIDLAGIVAIAAECGHQGSFRAYPVLREGEVRTLHRDRLTDTERGELGEYFRRRADGEFTFQTFTDGEKPDPDPLSRIRHGCLE